MHTTPTRTHTHTHTCTRTHIHTHSLSRIQTQIHYYYLSHTHIWSHIQAHTHTHAHTQSLLSLSLTHTHTIPPTHKTPHTQTQKSHPRNWFIKKTHTQNPTHHAGVVTGALAVAEGGGEGGGAALVVARCPPVVGGWVDGHCPHGGGVAVTVTVVVRTAVSRRPHIDVALAVATLDRKNEIEYNSSLITQWGHSQSQIQQSVIPKSWNNHFVTDRCRKTGATRGATLARQSPMLATSVEPHSGAHFS
jgi:hypothetical protein